MTEFKYIKGVRTRYQNVLVEEIKNGLTIMDRDTETIEEEDILTNVNTSMKTLEIYRERLESQSKKLCDAIEDDDDLLNTVIEQDGTLCENAIKCYIDLEEFKERLLKPQIKMKENVESGAHMEHLVHLQTEMQRMVIDQMKKQQDLFEKQDKIRRDQTAVRLPKLEMASFNGDKVKWTEFWDSYECTVHSNKNLSGIEKMNYLKSKLTGEAQNAISGLALSNDNYAVAIKTLKERFGNIQEVIDLHYTHMLNLPAPQESTASLRSFFDEIERHLRSLEVLKQDINQAVFVSMIKSKVPSKILVQLEMQKGPTIPWTVNRLRDSLIHYIMALESAEAIPNRQNSQTQSLKTYDNYHKNSDFGGNWNNSNKVASSSSEALVANVNRSNLPVPRFSADQCKYCTNQHYSDECKKYKTVSERKNQIKGSCFKCLREGHLANDCKTNKTCVHCDETKTHHRSLCPKKYNGMLIRESSSVSLSEGNKPADDNVPEENALISSNEMVLMQTALTEIQNPKTSKRQQTRILLDCGSQRTYITKALADKLGLKREKEQEIRLATFGSEKSKVIKTSSTTLSLKLNNGKYMNVTANIVPVISGNIVRKRVDVSTLGHLEHLVNIKDLADTIPKERECSTVELLLGNDYYLDVVLPQRLELESGLYLLGSKFGWILTGRTNDNDADNRVTNLLSLTYGSNLTHSQIFQSIDSSIQRKPDLEDFWNIEAIGIKDNASKCDDEKAMENFKETLKVENGRYQVMWPWKEDCPDLPEKKQLALGRLKSCVKKLAGNSEMLKKYDSVIQEQLKQGVIEQIPESNSTDLKHYIPHHAIVTPQKTTNKLRIVYDASAKTNVNNNSLNECLLRGPVMLHNLCGFPMRFRLHKTVLVADIERGFLQIGLQPRLREHTKYLLRSPIIKSPFKLKVGDVVLIKDNVPRGCWKTGQIYELITGRDGNIRSVKLRLPSGKILGRPLNIPWNIREILKLNSSLKVNLKVLKITKIGQCKIQHRTLKEKEKNKFYNRIVTKLLLRNVKGFAHILTVSASRPHQT